MKAILGIAFENTNLNISINCIFYFPEHFSRFLCFPAHAKCIPTVTIFKTRSGNKYLFHHQSNFCFSHTLPKRPPIIRVELVSSLRKNMFYFTNICHSPELSSDVSAACQAFALKWEKLLLSHNMLLFLPRLCLSLHSFADNESGCNVAMSETPKWLLQSLSPQVSCLISQDLLSLFSF